MDNGIRVYTMVLLMLWFCGFGVGCDTCNVGETFVNTRLLTGFENIDENKISLTITWDEGSGRAKDLPDSYFESVMMPINEEGICLDSNATEECMAIYFGAVYREHHQFQTLFSNAVPEFFASGDFSFYMYLPDRREHIECRHPGGEDGYSLKATIFLDDAGEIIDSAFVEEVHLGAI